MMAIKLQITDELLKNTYECSALPSYVSLLEKYKRRITGLTYNNKFYCR